VESNKPVHVSDEDFDFLLLHNNVSKVLEIGTGKSTRALVQSGAEVHTIDRVYRPLDFQAEQYIMESKEFWETFPYRGFDLYFIDASIGTGDAEEIFKRASNKFKIIFHDYRRYDKGVHNHKIMIKYLFDKCHIDESTGGECCSLLECEKL
jgi:hypothetical protein|tara:strand:+ start:508 stop:960 length:453 start_codon:yes stop_codon:yes gene_type:complete